MTFRLGFLLILSLCFAAPPVSAQESLILATADSAPFSTEARDGFYDTLLTEAFSALGIGIDIRRLPSERALHEASSGNLDGEFGRIPAIGELYPTLLLVPESLVEWQFTAFLRPGSRQPRSFDDLEGLHVGFINGWKIYEDNVTRARSVVQVDDEEQLFSILQAGRVDVILYSRLRGIAWMRRNPWASVRVADTPLSGRTMHLFLHSTHADLVPQIDNELRALKDSGRYAEIYESVFGFAP